MKELTIQNDAKSFIDPSKGKKVVDEGASFGTMLKDSFNTVNRLHNESELHIKSLALGEKKDIHQTMIAMEKADISFKLMMAVRDKVIRAYEEVMRMQI
jgi:flagellar hook-basal body complex protein FliE